MKIAVSYFSSNNYKKCIEQIDNSKADFIHVDLGDGKYIEAKNFVKSDLQSLFKNVHKPLDVHLMVKDPLKYIDALALLKVDTITIHIDSCKSPQEVINYIQSIGIKAGIALNPDQKIEMLMPFLSTIDRVLVMSVVPGKGGQAFIPETVDKISDLNNFREQYHFSLAIDGGINNETIKMLKGQNIDLFVCGSYITNSDNYDEQIASLK